MGASSPFFLINCVIVIVISSRLQKKVSVRWVCLHECCCYRGGGEVSWIVSRGMSGSSACLSFL